MLLAHQGCTALRGQMAVANFKVSVRPFRFAEVVSSLLAVLMSVSHFCVRRKIRGKICEIQFFFFFFCQKMLRC